MFLHYLKITFRNLWKYKTQSSISIIGLAVGFVCITFSAIWIRYEMTYDTQHHNAENIHYVIAVNKENPDNYNAVTPTILGERLKQILPEIEAAALVRFWCEERIYHNETNIENSFSVDAGFFDVFSVKFILGDKATAFSGDKVVVLSEETAHELFGSPEKAMGQLLPTKNGHTGEAGADYLVTGVVKDFEHSNLPFKALVKFIPTNDDGWYNNSYATYILLKEATNETTFYEKLKKVDIKEMGTSRYLKAVPINRMQYTYETSQQSRILPFVYIVVLAGISLLLFVCALLNYMSLYISRLLSRIRELGLRKVVGADMKQLLSLLITEFIVSMLLASFLGLCMMKIAQPVIEQATHITLGCGRLLGALGLFTAVGILLSLLTAIYPVWRICKIAEQTGMTSKNSAGRQRMQKALMIVQLVIGIFFLSVTSVMYSQLHFMRTKNLGFDRVNVLRIEPRREDYKTFSEDIDIIANELLENTAIQEVLTLPMEFFAENGANSTSYFNWEGRDETAKFMIAIMRVDYNFAEFFRIPMKEGQFYSKDFVTEKQQIVVNEKLAKIIGNPVVGKTIMFQGAEPEIIGVIADIQDRSLKYETPPTAIWLDNRPLFLYIRFASDQDAKALAHVDTVFKKHGIQNFSSQTMDKMLDDFSRSDIVVMRFIGLVAIVCLLISVFGVYSLTLYSMERRRREIAIRKVSGADVGDIIRMFIREYLWLVLIACIISVPFAWYIINKWLHDYANHIDMVWWLMVCVVVAVLIIVIVTVLKQIIKAADENPAEVVKSE